MSGPVNGLGTRVVRKGSAAARAANRLTLARAEKPYDPEVPVLPVSS
jgi:hypothetical protein